MIDLNGVAPMGFPTKSPPEEIREQVARLSRWLLEQREAKAGAVYVAANPPAIEDADGYEKLVWTEITDKSKPEPTQQEQAVHRAMMRGR